MLELVEDLPEEGSPVSDMEQVTDDQNTSPAADLKISVTSDKNISPTTNQDIAVTSDQNTSNQTSTVRSRKLKSLSLSDKLLILKEIEKGTRKKKDIAKEFGIPASTLSTIYKSRDKLQEFAEVVDSSRKRLKKAKHPDVEEETLKWLLAAQNPDMPISGTVIREKAQQFAQVLGYPDFQASVGWLEKFRSRYLYIVKNLQKKAACASENDLQKWTNEILPKIVKNYDEQNIFCANETCLFYKCFLEKNMADKCNYFNEEQINDWVTLLLATNMSGSEKLPILLIGKLQNPLSLSHVKSYAVQYEYNKQASMAPELFGAWLKTLDEKLVKQNRKIALIVNDNANHKKYSSTLKAIKVFLLPSNLASIFQPMDQGIIRTFKYFYRKNTVLKFVAFLESSKKQKTSMLDCVRDVHMAWESVTQTVISCSFKKAGFFKNNSGDITDFTLPLDNENIQEEWRKLKEISHIPLDMSFESYVNIDENFMLLTHISDNEIINELLYGDKDTKNELDSKPQYLPSFNEAFFASENLRCFIESRQNVPNSVFEAIAHIDQFLLKEKCTEEMQMLNNVSNQSLVNIVDDSQNN